MAAGKHREIHDVEQREKIISLITGEITFGQHVCVLVFGVNTFDLDFWVQIDSAKQTNQAHLCGFWDTCLIARLLPLISILITASSSSKNEKKQGTGARKFCV